MGFESCVAMPSEVHPLVSKELLIIKCFYNYYDCGLYPYYQVQTSTEKVQHSQSTLFATVIPSLETTVL